MPIISAAALIAYVAFVIWSESRPRYNVSECSLYRAEGTGTIAVFGLTAKDDGSGLEPLEFELKSREVKCLWI